MSACRKIRYVIFQQCTNTGMYMNKLSFPMSKIIKEFTYPSNKSYFLECPETHCPYQKNFFSLTQRTKKQKKCSHCNPQKFVIVIIALLTANVLTTL